MDNFSVTEARTLYFHRVLLDQARRTPGLMERARAALARMEAGRPNIQGVWDEWRSLLAGDAEHLEEAVLAASPRGGLLRAHSPLADDLADGERNALWQRVALQQFAAYFLVAAEDLDLVLAEQAALTGLTIGELDGWKAAPPLTMTAGVLEALKLVVALHSALKRLHPEREARRAWMRMPAAALGARPVDLLVRGDGDRIMEHLTGIIRPLLTDSDRPSH